MYPAEYRKIAQQREAERRLSEQESLAPVHLMALAQKLAHQFYALAGYEANREHDFRDASHPHEQMVWHQGCLAVETLRCCDMMDVCDEYDDDCDADS